MPIERQSVGRVVVGFDPESPELPALEIAAGLALELQVELAGLYVEDERLLRFAALPFARELCFPSASARRVAPEDIERSLRAQAARLRQLMATTAERFAISWRLDIVRGEVPGSALSSTGASDLLVVGGPRYRPLAPEPRERAAAGRHALPARPVVVLFEGSRTAARALALARDFAARLGSELMVLIPARDAEAFRKLRREAADLLGEAVAVSYMQMPKDGLDAIERALRARHAAAIFWPRSDDAEIAGLRARLSLPLVLIG